MEDQNFQSIYNVCSAHHILIHRKQNTLTFKEFSLSKLQMPKVHLLVEEAMNSFHRHHIYSFSCIINFIVISHATTFDITYICKQKSNKPSFFHTKHNFQIFFNFDVIDGLIQPKVNETLFQNLNQNHFHIVLIKKQSFI